MKPPFPPVPYDKTAVRPPYEDLPVEVRDDIAAHLGGAPIRVEVAGGGFTSGFAGTLTAANGRSLFVKAAGPQLPFVSNAYTQEAHINPALPEGTPAPRLRFASQVHDWVVLGFEAVHGTAPRLPMTAHQVDLMLDAWARAAELLRHAPKLNDFQLPPMSVGVAEKLQQFNEAAAGRLPLTMLPEPHQERIETLARLERYVWDATESGGITHGDLRPDNMIVTDGQAWICDWSWPMHGAAFFDTACFLAVARLGGHDSERLFWRHPTAHNVEGWQLDATLAAIAGYYLSSAQEPPIPDASPYMRRHQRQCGLATLDWLAARRGW